MRLVPAVAASAIALVTATAASAHAVLISTTPADGSVVATSPAQITLRFSEPVASSLGSVRVFGPDAEQLSTGGVTRPSPSTLAVPITGQLRKGTHTVAWRAVSADGHPVRGAFAFSVGEPSGTVVVDDLETSQSTAIAFWIVRFLSLLLVLATVGGSVTLAFCLRDASEQVRKRIAGSIALAAGLLVPVSLAGLVLQGSEATGLRRAPRGTLGRPLGGARHEVRPRLARPCAHRRRRRGGRARGAERPRSVGRRARRSGSSANGVSCRPCRRRGSGGGRRRPRTPGRRSRVDRRAGSGRRRAVLVERRGSLAAGIEGCSALLAARGSIGGGVDHRRNRERLPPGAELGTVSGRRHTAGCCC